MIHLDPIIPRIPLVQYRGRRSTVGALMGRWHGPRDQCLTTFPVEFPGAAKRVCCNRAGALSSGRVSDALGAGPSWPAPVLRGTALIAERAGNELAKNTPKIVAMRLGAVSAAVVERGWRLVADLATQLTDLLGQVTKKLQKAAIRVASNDFRTWVSEALAEGSRTGLFWSPTASPASPLVRLSTAALPRFASCGPATRTGSTGPGGGSSNLSRGPERLPSSLAATRGSSKDSTRSMRRGVWGPTGWRWRRYRARRQPPNALSSHYSRTSGGRWRGGRRRGWSERF